MKLNLGYWRFNGFDFRSIRDDRQQKMRGMILIVVDGIFSGDRQHFRGIYGVERIVVKEIITGNLDPDLMPGLEGMKYRHDFYLVFIDFIRFGPDGVPKWMKRLPGL